MLHEAGHAVAAMVLGGTLRSSVVSGGLRHGTIDGLTTVEMHQGREPELAYARVSAQAGWRHGRRPSQREVYAVLDTTGRCRWALPAAGGAAPATRITPLLERCWTSICEVAAQLHRQGDVRHDDVTAALGIPAKDNGHELALIRGGSAPGSFTVTRPVPA